MGWIGILILGLIFLGPMLGLMGGFSASAFFATVSTLPFQKSLAQTLLSGMIGAAFSVLIAVFFAKHFASFQWKTKRIQKLCLLIPYLIPNFVLASAFVMAWNPSSGLLNGILPYPGGMYGMSGMIALFAIVHFPIAFLLLEDKLSRIDPVWIEAARLSGARPQHIFRRIELPLITPTVVSAWGLCYALNLSAFAIPAWIGVPGKSALLTYKIYQTIQLGGPEGLDSAATIAVILFLMTLPSLILTGIFQQKEKKWILVGGKASRRSLTPPSRRQSIVFHGLFWVTQLLFWIAPLGLLALSTLTPPGCLQEKGKACLSSASLKNYHTVLFQMAETSEALKNSLIYGCISAGIIIGLSIGILIFLKKSDVKLNLLQWILAIPVSTPGAIIALGLIVTASGKYGINLYNTAWIAVAAFVIKHMNLAFQPIRSGLSAVSSSLTEAAALSGASSVKTWTRITLPIVRPELMGAGFLVLIPILGELTMSVFLTSPSFRSIGTVLFDLQDYADQASAGAMSILLVCFILILNFLTRVFSKGKLGY